MGGGILYLASEEGCLPLGLREVQCGLEKSLPGSTSHKNRTVITFVPWYMRNFVIVGITQVAIFFAFFGPKFNYHRPGNWGNFFVPQLGHVFMCGARVV